jgi:hypothetical protein
MLYHGAMDYFPPTAEAFDALLRAEIARLASAARRAYIESRLTAPYRVTLRWEYGNNEPHTAWVFADLRRADVMAVYCLGGHDARGSPWGLNFRTSTHFGMDSGWFRSLDELLEDEGVEV